MAKTFDPYHLWLGIPPEEQPPNHYRLLGIKLLEHDADVISSAADRQMAHVRSFQSGKHGPESQKLLNDLSAARVCLLSAEKKAIYDQALQSQLTKQAGAAAPPPAAPPAAPPPPAVTARPLRVAQPVAAVRPAAVPSQAPVPSQANVPADPLGFDPLAEDSTPRHRRRKRPTQQPAILAGIAAGLVALLGLFLGIAGSGRNEPKPVSQTVAAAKKTTDSVDQKDRPQTARDRKITPKIESSDDESGTAPATDASDATPVDIDPEPGDDEPSESSPDSMPTDEAQDIDADATESPDPAPAREAVPDAEALKGATADIHALFKDDFAAAKKRDQKAALSEKLFALAQDSSVPLERYALLYEAKRLAIGAADPGLAMQALTALTEHFDLGRLELATDMIEGFGEKDLAPAAREALVEAVMPLIDEAAASGQFKLARRLAASGLAVARKSNQTDAAKALARQSHDLAAKEKLAEAAEAARKQLEAKPDDADAHLALGKYLCFGADNWTEGLPHLAAGSDAELRKAAERELAAATSTADQVEIGDLWWDLAESAKGADKDPLRARAGYWYEQAVGELAGLAKAKVEKRLEAIGETPKVATAGGDPPKSMNQAANAATADKIVLWNTHNGHWADRGTTDCNIELRRSGKGVWSQNNVKVTWNAGDDPTTIVPIPRVPFDTLRIDIIGWRQWGAGLTEVEVLRGKRNLATKALVTVNGELGACRGLCAIDGIKSSSTESNGYWLAPDHKPAWIEFAFQSSDQAPAVSPSEVTHEGGAAVFLSELPKRDVREYPDAPKPVSLNGKGSSHGIYLHPTTNSFSHATYDLAGQFKTISGRAGINDTVVLGTRTPLTFRILVDGQERFKSRPLQHTGDSQEFRVSVASGRTLELLVDCPGPDTSAHAVWFEPQLTKGKGSPTLKSAAAKPAETKAIGGGKWIDLLSLTDPAKQHLEAAWRRTPDGLRVDMPGKPIQLPAAVDGDYTLHVEFTRLFGNDAVVVIIPALSKQCMLGISAFHGELSGVELINGQGYYENPATIRPGTLENGHRYDLDLNVRQRSGQLSIETKLDGKLFVHWSGEVSSLGLWKDWNISRQDVIALAANEPTVFHAAKLKMLSGKATVDKDSSPPMTAKSGSDSGASAKKIPAETKGAAPHGPAIKPTRGKTQFLADLPPHDVRAIHPLTGDLSLKGVASPHGIFLHPADHNSSHVAYDLAGRFLDFTGRVGINDSVLEGSASQLTFRIVGDGKELWKSRPLQQRADSQEFKVSIADVRELELLVDCPGASAYAQAVWFEPQLTITTKNSRPKTAGAAPSSAAQDKTAASKLLKDAVLIATFDDSTVLREKGEIHLRDLSGKQTPGLVVGAKLVPGKAGQGLSLQKPGEHVDWGTDASLNPPFFSVCAWIKPATHEDRFTDILSKHGEGHEKSGFVLRVKNDLPELFIGIGDGQWHILRSKTLLPHDQWFHLGVTHNATTSSIYVNGQLARSAPSDGPVIPAIERCFIGSTQDSDALQFYGLIDEVALFDRALSAAEVQQIYALGANGKSLAPPGNH